MLPSDLFDHGYAENRGVNPEVLEQTVALAIEIAREGREGRKVGTLFVIADSEVVLAHSRPMIYDPLLGHPPDIKHLNHPDMRETIKELAQLDGAFVVSEEGVVLSACRYIDASAAGVELPMGLGSRHMAAASITSRTEAIAVVVSESSVVRIFDDGELVSEIIPELWMLRRFTSQVEGPLEQHTEQDVTVVSKRE